MNEEELIKFLKKNLRINIAYNGYDYNWDDAYKISISLEDEEICSTQFAIDSDIKFHC